MNTPVSFESAKLLKEKGFKVENIISSLNERELYQCKYGELWLSVYLKDKSLTVLNNGSFQYRSDFEFIAPTISDAVMWLYENHGIWIYPFRHDFNNEFYWHIDTSHEDEFTSDMNFNSPTEAYEAAIEHTLKNLIYK